MSDDATGPSRDPEPVTAEAPSNIAFIKYWGAFDLDVPVPCNRSLSMTLDACRSICQASPLPAGGDDEIVWLERPSGSSAGPAMKAPPAFVERTRQHLDRLREWSQSTEAPYNGCFRVATGNTFPAAAGIASSASGFTALTLAVTAAMGFDLSPQQLSALSRSSGSGSAARSAFGGYVEWPDGENNCAVQVLDEHAWPLRDVVAVVAAEPKKVSSRDGHRAADSSPYFARRLEALEGRLAQVRRALSQRDFDALGAAVEEEGIDLHLIAMSSRPPVFYWSPATLAVLSAVRALRAGGVSAWSTTDAGANVHVICQPEDEEQVASRLLATSGVERVLRDRTGGPPRWRRGAGP